MGSNLARAWTSVSFECCVLSGRGLCDGLITRPEESYRLCGVSECDREASIMRRNWHTGGCCAEKRNVATKYSFGEESIGKGVHGRGCDFT